MSLTLMFPCSARLLALLIRQSVVRRNITTCTSFDTELIPQSLKNNGGNGDHLDSSISSAPERPTFDDIDSTSLETEYTDRLSSYQVSKLNQHLVAEIAENKLAIARHMEAIGKLKDSVIEIEEATLAIAILLCQEDTSTNQLK